MCVVQQQGAVNVIRGDVSLLQDDVDSLHAAVVQCSGGGQPMIVLDMSETQLVDSSGLEALLEAHENVELRGGSIKMAAPVHLVSDILRATGISEKFECFPEVKSAVGSFLR